MILLHLNLVRTKKRWTTKNTHLKRYQKQEKDEGISWTPTGILVVVIILVFLIGLIVKDHHVVGYDRFIGMPIEWMKSLKDMNVK